LPLYHSLHACTCREIATTLRAVGVPLSDTRDELERERFFVLGLVDERRTTKAKDPDYWYIERILALLYSMMSLLASMS